MSAKFHLFTLLPPLIKTYRHPFCQLSTFFAIRVKILPEKRFLCCHQSFLVNMDRIWAAEDDFRMDTGEVVPIRVRERRAIREA